MAASFPIKKGLLLVSLLVLSSAFQSKAEPPKILGEAETTWPGVKIQVTNLIRIDATHVLAAVHLSAGSDAPGSTFIGYAAAAAASQRFAPLEEQGLPQYQPTAYSLTEAKLLDQNTKQEFKADPNVPEK